MNFIDIKPQIDGFNQDIYDPNLKIDVFDPYFYRVMITRFYFYVIVTDIKQKIRTTKICQYYDSTNFQSKAQEFFSIIIMPNQSDSNYKEALIKIFILTLFENTCNYLVGNISLCFRFTECLNNSINNTFLKYFLCDSIYKDDFKNLVSSDDLDNIDFPISEITYLFPKNTMYNKIISYQNLSKLYQLINYDTNPPNYSEMNVERIKVERKYIIKKNIHCNESPDNSFIFIYDYEQLFYSHLWNIFRIRTQIYQLRITNVLYQPIVSEDLDKYIGTYMRNDFIEKHFRNRNMYKKSFDTYFENIDYYNQKLKGKLLERLLAHNYCHTIIGYLIYKDDVNLTSSIIQDTLLSIKKNRIKTFIYICIRFLPDNYIIQKQLIYQNQNLCLILESIKNSLIKISVKDANVLCRDILKSLFTIKDQSIKKFFIELCQQLYNKSLSIV